MAGDYENKLLDVILGLDTDLQRTFTNHEKVSSTKKASMKNPKDKSIQRQYKIETSKIPIMPAMTMLHRAKEFDFNNVRNVRTKNK